MKIPVLDKDDSWEYTQEKLIEEYIELQNAINDLRKRDGTIEHVAEETFDVIQICVGILDKLESKHPGIATKENKKHLKKLINRGWNIKNLLWVVKLGE